MRFLINLKLLFVIPFLLCITSCKQYIGINGYKEYDYTQIEKYRISWNDIFIIAKPSYFIYFYDKNCRHCFEIKNQIIAFRLEEGKELYFIEKEENIKYGNDVYKTIGKTSLEDLYIYGFPSLIMIGNSSIQQNVYGKRAIFKLLSEN